MKKSYKMVLTSMAVLLVMLTQFPNSYSAVSKGYKLSLATATIGGTWYPVGVGMATLWTEKLKNHSINVSAQSSAGSPENIDMLRKGEVEMAMLQGLLAGDLYFGKGLYEKKQLKNIRGMLSMFPNYLHYVIMSKKVKTGNVKDIDGLHYSPGPAGGGGQITFKFVSQALGLKIREERLGFTPSAEAMRNGTLDGASFDAFPPVPVVMDLYSTPNLGVQLLSFTNDDINKLNKVVNGAWWLETVKANTYPNQKVDIQVACYTNLLTIMSEIPDDVVYKMLMTLFENKDYLNKVHSSAKSITIENALKGMTLPLHTGAVKFYQERGVKIPKDLMP